jgi:hypothetical protein
MDEQEQRKAALIEKIRQLSGPDASTEQHYEAITLSQAVLHETLGDRHPLMVSFNSIIENYNWSKADGSCKTLITLYEQGRLVNPRFQIAKELEGDVINVAEQQWKEAEHEGDLTHKQIRLSVSTFLCGAALEDALRRLCDKHGRPYDATNTSIAKLQAVLYSPSNGVEIITKSENVQVGGWGQTRNKADHGHFSEITSAEVQAMIVGTRGLIEKHLP